MAKNFQQQQKGPHGISPAIMLYKNNKIRFDSVEKSVQVEYVFMYHPILLYIYIYIYIYIYMYI